MLLPPTTENVAVKTIKPIVKSKQKSANTLPKKKKMLTKISTSRHRMHLLLGCFTIWKVGRTVENYHCIGYIFCEWVCLAVVHSISVSNQLIRKVMLAWISFSLVLQCGIVCIVPSFLTATILYSHEMRHSIDFRDALHTYTLAIDPRNDRNTDGFQNGPLDTYTELLFGYLFLSFSLSFAFPILFLTFWWRCVRIIVDRTVVRFLSF